MRYNIENASYEICKLCAMDFVHVNSIIKQRERESGNMPRDTRYIYYAYLQSKSLRVKVYKCVYMYI